ncbi:hypothetical protein OAV62_01065 [bacterium]|nr:hypothetical protein [bacterium]
MFSKKPKSDSIFNHVQYRQFRQYMQTIGTHKIDKKGYETHIFSQSGELKAIIHAASIDAAGNCHPAEYYIFNEQKEAAMDWLFAA